MMNERTSLPPWVACSDPECRAILEVLAPLEPVVFWCPHPGPVQESQPSDKVVRFSPAAQHCRAPSAKLVGLRQVRLGTVAPPGVVQAALAWPTATGART